MKKKALRKDFYIEIKRSYNRFFSILLIVTLGVAFFSGVRATKPDMQLSADAFYDESRLMDIRVLSDLGLTDEDLSSITAIKGVEDAIASYSQDVLCDTESAQLVVKMMSLQDNMNLISVKEGRMPKKTGECLADVVFMNTTGYQIGDVITVKTGTEDPLEDTLKDAEYTIVGTGTTSYYLSFERGSSSIGSGELNSFLIITPSDFTLEAYTEIYVRVKDALILTSYSNEYDKKVEEVVDNIEAISDKRCQLRYREVIEESNQKIEDAEKKVADAEQELEDAKQELDDGKQKLEEGKVELADGKQKLSDSEASVVEGEEELLDAKKELIDAKKELDDGRVELDENWEKSADARIEVMSQKQKLEEGEKTLNEGKSKIVVNEAELSEGEKQLVTQENTLNSLNSAIINASTAGNDAAGLNAKRDALVAVATYFNQTGITQEKLESMGVAASLAALLVNVSAIQTLPDTEVATINGLVTADIGIISASLSTVSVKKDEIAVGWQKINLSKKKIEEKEAEIKEAWDKIHTAEYDIIYGEQDLADAEKEWQEGLIEYSDGLQDYEEGIQDLTDGKKKLEKAKVDLAEAEQKLAEAEYEYKDGEKKYYEAKEEADVKLSDAKADIADGKKKVAELETPKWHVLDREYIRTYVEYGQDADRIGAIGEVFPFLFFLVAALVSLTTMTRMVEEERTQIGTLRALGYNNMSIAGKYLLYALLASLLGSGLGLVLGQKILPPIIISSYAILYDNLPVIMSPLNAWYSLSSTLVAVFCTTVATLLACYKEFAVMPSILMRPVTPKAGKRVFVERIVFIWKKLNFTQKSTIRNLIRYKKRFLMTVFGIGGCTALLLVGFGIKDSIVAIGDLQFGEIRTYDADIAIEEKATNEEKELLYHTLLEDKRVASQMYGKQMAVDAKASNILKSGYLIIPEDNDKISDFITFRNRVTHEKYKLNDEGVIITEKLATLLVVKVGDLITLKEDDSSEVQVEVSAITENYFMHYIYMSSRLYEQTFKKSIEYSEILLNNASNEKNLEMQMGTDYMELDSVAGIAFYSGTAERVRNMLKSINMIIYVLVVSAGLLAFVVLYNLNSINVNERKRELATLKVLGFFDGEVSAYMNRENIILTIFGTIAGIVMGLILHRFVIITAEIDIMMFGRNINLMSYLYSIMLTFTFSVIVNIVMHFKLRRINMIESLKSVE